MRIEVLGKFVMMGVPLGGGRFVIVMMFAVRMRMMGAGRRNVIPVMELGVLVRDDLNDVQEREKHPQ